MLNNAVIMGRLTKDVELRRTQSGKPVASFTLAVDRDGEGVDFIDVVAWERTAEHAANYFCKGKMAVVSGRMQIRSWTDKEGNKRRTAEVVANRVYFADSRRETDSTSSGPLRHLPLGKAYDDEYELVEDDDRRLPF